MAGPLPRVLEVKRTLSGAEKRFECAVLWQEGPHLVVLFVAPGAMRVHGVALPAGTVTFGHFWTDRPYNVYHWLDGADGGTIAYYVNLSQDTRLAAGVLEWLDLAVDILITPDQTVAILDEDEIPADADGALRGRIADAKATVLRSVPALVREMERHRAALSPSPWRVPLPVLPP